MKPPFQDRSAARLLFWAMVLLLAQPGHTAAAGPDQVTLRKPGSLGRILVSGQIVEFNGSVLQLKPMDGGALLSFPAAEVVSIEMLRGEAHQRGLESFRKGHPADAARALEQALRDEPRAWGRREILAELVRCAVAQADYPAAGARFLNLYDSDPETRHWRVIPLVWISRKPDPATRASARTWMSETKEPARLLGASLAIGDPELTRTAESTLRELARTGGLRIQPLAQWQLRRDEVFSGRAGLAELPYWERALENVPPDLQGGPCYLLGEAYSRQHDHTLAAAFWTRLTVSCDHDLPLAALATIQAARALERIGQPAESRTLLLEAVERFPGTSPASEARRALETTVPIPNDACSSR